MAVAEAGVEAGEEEEGDGVRAGGRATTDEVLEANPVKRREKILGFFSL